MSNVTLQAIYDAAKRFTEDVENLAGLRSAIEAHDAEVAAQAEPAPEAAPEPSSAPEPPAEPAAEPEPPAAA
jgi:hypothetical protein